MITEVLGSAHSDYRAFVKLVACRIHGDGAGSLVGCPYAQRIYGHSDRSTVQIACHHHVAKGELLVVGEIIHIEIQFNLVALSCE